MTLEPGSRVDAVLESPSALSARLLEAIGHAIVVVNRDGVIVVWNAGAERLLGWTSTEAVGLNLSQLQLDPLAVVAAETLDTTSADLPSRELHLLRRDRAAVTVVLYAAPMGPLGAASGVVLALVDLTRHSIAEQRLEAEQDRLKTLVQHSADMVTLIDPDGTIRFVSAGVADRAGLSPNELVGGQAFDLVHPDDRPRLRATVTTIAARDGATADVLFRLGTSDGRYLWMQGRVVNMLRRPHVGALLVTVHDVTERVYLEWELAHQATHDTLTGLPNRALFEDRVEHHVEHARRHGLTVAVFFWDLDEFKHVNDVCGHAVGDSVLVESAKHALGALRAEDTVARFGGDEFVACAEVEDAEQAAVLGRRLLAHLPVDVTTNDSQRLHIAASIGVACGANVSAPVLLSEADNTMYDVKRRGGNDVLVRQIPADGT